MKLCAAALSLLSYFILVVSYRLISAFVLTLLRSYAKLNVSYTNLFLTSDPCVSEIRMQLILISYNLYYKKTLKL